MKTNKTKKKRAKRPVDIIRAMNPGSFIPTGAQLAAMLRKRK